MERSQLKYKTYKPKDHSVISKYESQWNQVVKMNLEVKLDYFNNIKDL